MIITLVGLVLCEQLTSSRLSKHSLSWLNRLSLLFKSLKHKVLASSFPLSANIKWDKNSAE